MSAADGATIVVANGVAEPGIAADIAKICRTYDNRHRLLRISPYAASAFEIHEIDTNRISCSLNWTLFGKARYAENSGSARKRRNPDLELMPSFLEVHRLDAGCLLHSLLHCLPRWHSPVMTVVDCGYDVVC